MVLSMDHKESWSNENNQILIKLWYSLDSIFLISIKMGRTVPSIQTHSSRISLPPRKTIYKKKYGKNFNEGIVDFFYKKIKDKKIIHYDDIIFFSEENKASIEELLIRTYEKYGDIIDFLKNIPFQEKHHNFNKMVLNNVDTGYRKTHSNNGVVKTCLKCRKKFWVEEKDKSYVWKCFACKKKEHSSF